MLNKFTIKPVLKHVFDTFLFQYQDLKEEYCQEISICNIYFYWTVHQLDS